MSSTSRKPWSPIAKTEITIALAIIAIYLLFRFQIILIPLVLALILAFLLSPLASFLQHRLKVRRGLAVAMVYLIMIGLIILVPALLVPVLVDQANSLNLDLQQTILAVEQFIGRSITIGNLTIDGQQIVMQVEAGLQGLLEPMFGQTLGLAIDILGSVVWLVFTLVIAFYLTKDSEDIGRWIQERLPLGLRPDYRLLAGEINAIWSAFFRGQLVLALVVAVLISVAGTVIGLPFSLAMGVLAGLLEFLPSVGHGVWLFFASMLMLFQGSTWIPVPNWVAMLIVIGLHLIFQQLDLNYLIPLIIGRRVRLHPLIVILGIVAGASLAGVLGILLAAPTIATARTIARYLSANLLDENPFPAAGAQALLQEDGDG
jgi:predicted PurR-regulated permease PerM